MDPTAGGDCRGSIDLQLELLTEILSDQARALSALGTGTHDPALVYAALGAELDAVKNRVRQQRVRIGARVAAQRKSAHHVETRAQCLEERLAKVRERRRRLLELDLAIAHAEIALVASQVDVDEAVAQLAAYEREINLCTTEYARLRESGFEPEAAGTSVRNSVQRIRSRLAELYDHARSMHALELIACRNDAAQGVPLLEVLARWRAAVDVLDASLLQPPALEQEAKTDFQLESGALRTQLELRMRMLFALGELRVELMQALHDSAEDEPVQSPADLARLTSVRIGVLLDEAQRAWVSDTLEAAAHEQSARLPPAAHSAEGARALLAAVSVLHTCESKLADAAAQGRSLSHDLAALRNALTPALASAHAEGRALGLQIRERQATLRSRNRKSERATSRLRLARERRRGLRANLQRARDTLDESVTQVGAKAIVDLVNRSLALERDVEAGAALVAGLRAAHDRGHKALVAMERALLELGRRERARATPAAEGELTGEPAARARMERDIAALCAELERWKSRHAQLERRVDAQAEVLASLDGAPVVGDSALTELRERLEHAQTTAAAELQRAIARPASAASAAPEAASED